MLHMLSKVDANAILFFTWMHHHSYETFTSLDKQASHSMRQW